MWFPLLCLLAAGIPLTILYLLYGPTRPRPVVAISRVPHRLATAPAYATARRYEPERVFASEQRVLIASASSFARTPILPSDPLPRPMPRTRAARGSEGPPAHPVAHGRADAANPFAEEGPTFVGEVH